MAMPDIKNFLKQLIDLPGLSGYESPVRDLIADAWRPLVDELAVSKLGSLHGIRRGNAPDPRPRILLAAHMDAIGLIVSRVTPQGFLYFTEVGGIDPRILVAQPVLVYGRQTLPGVIAQTPDRLLPPPARGKPVEMSSLFVDTGLSGEEINRLVRVGDLISFATQPLELAGDLIAGHNLDNRASVAAVTACLQELQQVTHSWDVIAGATVQEEVSLGGAYTSTFELRPDIAVAIDVTFAKGPGVSDYRGRGLGKGVALSWGPNSHPAVFDGFKSLAERLDVPFELEVYTAYSGTDAMGMQIVSEGVPTMVLGIPLRYMHTPVEVVSYKDIYRTGHLLAQYIAGLATDSLSKIVWDAANP
jgi:endoglucanase